MLETGSSGVYVLQPVAAVWGLSVGMEDFSEVATSQVERMMTDSASPVAAKHIRKMLQTNFPNAAKFRGKAELRTSRNNPKPAGHCRGFGFPITVIKGLIQGLGIRVQGSMRSSVKLDTIIVLTRGPAWSLQPPHTPGKTESMPMLRDPCDKP